MACLVVFEGGVLVDPVRVQHAHVRELSAHALLSHGPKVAHSLDLVDTVVLGLTCGHTRNTRNGIRNNLSLHTDNKNLTINVVVAKKLSTNKPDTSQSLATIFTAWPS